MNIDEGLDFEPIIETLNKHRVAYVVIGGVAGLLHGADLPRTFDLDITPASDNANRKRLAVALKELEAKLRAPGLDEGFPIALDRAHLRPHDHDDVHDPLRTSRFVFHPRRDHRI